MPENRQVAKEGGTIAGHARREIETKTGKPAISQKKIVVKKDKKLSGGR